MPDDKEVLDDNRDNGSAEANDHSEQREPREHVRDQRAGKDTRAQIRKAIDEHRGKTYDDEGEEVKPDKTKAERREEKRDARDAKGQFAAADKSGKEGADAEGKKPDPAAKTEIPAKAVNEEAKLDSPQAKSAIAPPDALSPDIRAIWGQIPEAVQKEFVRREEDGKRGVEQLKARYKGYDDAFTPVRDELSSLGKTEAEGIKLLVDWRLALRGPHKVQAFKALAQSEGITVEQLVGSQPSSGATNQPQHRQPQAFDPNAFRPMIDPVIHKVSALEATLQRQAQERVQTEIADMSKGKPHFEKVRVAMGHLMNSGQITGDNPREVFDRAYTAACYANEEVRELMQQEAEAKRQADAQTKAKEDADKAAEAEAKRKRDEREALDKARKAAVGPRGGSPSGSPHAKPSGGESVGDTLRRVASEARSAV